jgi:hypothetical protein
MFMMIVMMMMMAVNLSRRSSIVSPIELREDRSLLSPAEVVPVETVPLRDPATLRCAQCADAAKKLCPTTCLQDLVFYMFFLIHSLICCDSKLTESPASYLGGRGFKSRQGDRLSRLSFNLLSKNEIRLIIPGMV